MSKLNGAEKKTTPEVASSQEPGSKVPVAAGNDDPWITRLNATGEMPIGTKTKDGHTIYRIRVEPEETLGHYADWLGGGTTHPIRRLNGLKHGQQLRMGQSLRLPIKGENSKQLFIENRREYHRTLSEEFQEHYQIVGIENYTVKRGDNLWKIAEESELPFWVLTRFNPMVQKRAPNVGEVLQLPKIRAKRPQQEAPTKVVPSAG